MARGSHDLSPWRRNSLTIPPNSLDAWLRLAVWELWMGMLVCLILGFGIALILSSPDRVFKFSDYSHCYAPAAAALPCERMLYQAGMLNAAFTSLCGVMLIVAGAWLLWELWSAVEPKPITDDFLKLLNDSFGRSWRDPSTWPWARVLLAYGFTAIGAAMTAGIGVIIWTLVASPNAPKMPTARIETSQTFTVGK